MIEQAQRDDVTARAGLPLVVETMRALGMDEVAASGLPRPKRQRGFAPEQELEALVTLLAAGGDRVEDVRVLAEDEGLEKLLGAPFPSPDPIDAELAGEVTRQARLGGSKAAVRSHPSRRMQLGTFGVPRACAAPCAPTRGGEPSTN